MKTAWSIIWRCMMSAVAVAATIGILMMPPSVSPELSAPVKPTPYGNGVWYFHATGDRFGFALSCFRQEYVHLAVVSITSGSHGETANGYWVITRWRTEAEIVNSQEGQ